MQRQKDALRNTMQRQSVGQSHALKHCLLYTWYNNNILWKSY